MKEIIYINNQQHQIIVPEDIKQKIQKAQSKQAGTIFLLSLLPLFLIAYSLEFIQGGARYFILLILILSQIGLIVLANKISTDLNYKKRQRIFEEFQKTGIWKI